ncbi:unnamed protein product [Rotaria sordida]|uniref:Uncharacterized protein n=1 Tax=Rotaria sordida TaxID=392033 RepID=A0A815ARI5_9BILA|nr:unnamed protein product [Rotaria sordida]CAF1324618.1 unnamed protein product [Rotaria sordida]
MYNQIKSQFPSNHQEIIALTGNDYKELLSETMDQITINLQIEEGFESVQDPVAIDQILNRQLQYKQVRMTQVGDQFWESLYWTPELTRPDRLPNVLNKIIEQDATDSDKFRYNYSQRDEAFKQDLKLNERLKIDDFKRHVAATGKDTRRTTDIGAHGSYESGVNFAGKV